MCGSTSKDDRLFDALAAGIRHCGDDVEATSDDIKPCQLDCDYIGLHGLRRLDWLFHCMDTHTPFLYLDKGYRRQEKERDWFWRVGVNETHPADYIAMGRHNSGRVARLQKAMGLPLQIPEWRAPTAAGPIIIASSSEKFHVLHNLPPPREWVAGVIQKVRAHTKRPILYRPKPNYAGHGPIEGCQCVGSIKHMGGLFAGCHVLITHGSYICVDAMLAGVPSIVLGNGVLRHISSTDISEVEEPSLASHGERQQAMANLAWTQYTVDEWQNGTAWRSVRRLFLGVGAW